MESRERLMALFEEMADLLELAGANPFKVRAYRNAARTLQTLAVPLKQLLDSPPKGFGESMCRHVEEFIAGGRLAEMDALKTSFPPGLFEMMRVPGLGPKKVARLREKLGIDDLAKLEAACSDGRIVALEGFGEKSVKNIIDGIELVRKFSGRFLFSDAESVVDRLLEWLHREAPEAEYHAAGSFRPAVRRGEDVQVADRLPSAPEDGRRPGHPRRDGRRAGCHGGVSAISRRLEDDRVGGD